jgi:DNA-binding CsgD family transcriptional regulator
VLSGLFGLTRSEALLARALTSGKTLEESAQELGITISSARTYLKRAFGKTNTNRQAELIRLILTSTAAAE